MKNEQYFAERDCCPFCAESSKEILANVDYHDTAEANKQLPNVKGELFACNRCGVAYPSHVYTADGFSELYRKTLNDWAFFDATIFQRVRKKCLKIILSNYHRTFSVSRLLDASLFHVLQVPIVRRRPRRQRILDVGCGFGEFLVAFRELDNEVIGTEIIPALVDRLKRMGADCRLGEIENIGFSEMMFEVIIFRAVLYRTRNPIQTIEAAKSLLAPGGEIALVDPCPGPDGVEYYFRKQFPQGQFYILDREKYLACLRDRFNLVCKESRLIYGRPKATLKPLKYMGVVMGLGELLYANLFSKRPYVLSYSLEIL